MRQIRPKLNSLYTSSFVCLTVLTIWFLTSCDYQKPEEKEIQLTDYVDPFIGTDDEGNTNPGAVLPWGLVSVSPHTFDFTRQISPTSYRSDSTHIYAFSFINLSGIGCPAGGSVPVKLVKGSFSTDVDQVKSTFSEEKAKPGYYSVILDKQRTKVEATSTLRSGILKFSLPAGESHIYIDLTANQGHFKGGLVNLDASGGVSGFQLDGNFCGSPTKQKIYFYAKTDLEPDSIMLLNNDPQDTKEVNNKSIGNNGAVFSFNLTQATQISLRVGLSFVSADNARDNLMKEQKDLTFEDIKQNANDQWIKQLEKINVSGSNKNNKIKFYTALYHSLLLPQTYSDYNGQYKVMGSDSVASADYTRYTTYSLWDTYRTVHPLLTLVYPEIQTDMMKSMIGMYQESGWLPKWELFGQEAGVMVGDPGIPVIVDSYMKGLTDIDANVALEAMIKHSDQEIGNFIRPGIRQYNHYGYIPMDDRGGDPMKFKWFTDMVWGPVSTTQEYNLADYNISVLANALGKKDVSSRYLNKSHSFLTLFDTTTQFLRPKNKDGSWMDPFNPTDRYFDIRWKKSGGKGYVEGTAWQYLFFVPHALDTLKSVMGKETFYNKLTAVFDEGHFDMTNEPDISYPYIFNYIEGKEDLTAQHIHKLIEEHFTLDKNGIPGNDDAGTLSAWLVFSMMGIYPDVPGKPHYQITTPTFDTIKIKLNPAYYTGESLIINKQGNNVTLNEILFNGESLDSYKIDHQTITKGGELILNTGK
ncbi:GH92 family glycosyl hydrolase [Marinigracilibium pacificum]|uniref:Glycoside hydrolase family 92 protein n=1 Tax=Marinigracilibium pacificum TaxID=2729599 RepID=A0A848J1C7_9BACT|nr:glycoside hydrolase family 92 protein [Marinigracilibium pacificum]